MTQGAGDYLSSRRASATAAARPSSAPPADTTRPMARPPSRSVGQDPHSPVTLAKNKQPGADLQRRRREAPGRQPGGPPRPAGRQGDGGAGQQPEPQRDPAVDRGPEVDDQAGEERRHRPGGAPTAGRGDEEAPDRQHGQRDAERPAPRGVDRGREPALGVDIGEARRARRAPRRPWSERAHHHRAAQVAASAVAGGRDRGTRRPNRLSIDVTVIGAPSAARRAAA